MPSKTVYDVLHDIKCHQEWDTDIIDTHDIIQLATNADVGYYAWRCLKPWKHRDVVTLRSGQVEDGYRTVINFSIKHPTLRKGEGREDGRQHLIVRCVCTEITLQVVKNLHKACVKYPAWKQQHDANVKPGPCPEQNMLRLWVLAELALQCAGEWQ